MPMVMRFLKFHVAAALLIAAPMLTGCLTETRKAAAAPVAGTPVPPPDASANRILTARTVFLRTPPPLLAQPDSAAAKAIIEAQAFFQNGQTDAAADRLRKALAEPACQTNQVVLSRKLIALLLVAGRVLEAQAAYLASGTDGIADPFNAGMIGNYLMFEADDLAAADAWASRLEALPLAGRAAEANLANQLTAVTLAGRTDALAGRLTPILARTNAAENAALVRSVTVRFVQHAEFDAAARFVGAVEAAAGGKEAYRNQVANLRKLIERAGANRHE